jgi:hypothetical protein
MIPALLEQRPLPELWQGMGGDLSQKLFLMVNCLHRISYRQNRIGGARM